MRHLAACMLLVSACSLSLDAGDVAIVCNDDADCPTGRCELSIQRCFAAGTGTPLRFTSAVAVSSVRVDAVFNQEVAPGSIVDLSQVSISPPLALTGFSLDSTNQRLSITTEPQAFDVVYTMTVTGFVASTGDPLDVSARSQSFASFLGLADRSPPSIIRPADGSLVRGGEVGFAWQAITNATSYTVEVRRRDAVAPPIVVEVPGSTTVTTIDLPTDGTFDWRVRADITAPDIYSSATFDILVDAVYVFCPEGDCDARVGNGSRRAPVRRINEGLVLARQLGIGVVRVAERPNDATYDEALVLVDIPVTLDGGFDAAFTPGGGRASIAAVGTVLLARPASGALRVENVALVALGGPSLEAVSIEGGTNVTLANVTIVADRPVDTNIGINIDGRPDIADVNLDAVVLTMAASTAAGDLPSESMTGVRVLNGRLTMTGGLVAVGLEPTTIGPGVVRGIDLVDLASLTATGVNVGTGFSRFSASAFYDQRFARAPGAPPLDIIDDSRFWVTTGAAAITTMFFSSQRGLVFRNSVIVAGKANDTEAIRVSGNLDLTGLGPFFIHDVIQIASDRRSTAVASTSARFVIANSIITTSPCTDAANCAGFGGNRCLATQPNLGPATLVGTALVCETPYAGLGLGSPDFTQPNPSCVDGLGRVIRCNGTTAVAPPLDAYVVDVAGFDTCIACASDNDYHLVSGAPASLRTGGVDLTGNVCGWANETLPCNAPTRDADGVLRSAPFSMGAYEY